MLQQYYKSSKDIDLEKNVSYYIHKQENKTKNTSTKLLVPRNGRRREKK